MKTKYEVMEAISKLNEADFEEVFDWFQKKKDGKINKITTELFSKLRSRL